MTTAARRVVGDPRELRGRAADPYLAGRSRLEPETQRAVVCEALLQVAAPRDQRAARLAIAPCAGLELARLLEGIDPDLGVASDR